MPGALDRIPPELWLQIFRILPQDTLPNVSLTNRTFRGIIYPLLFAHFDFHTHSPIADADLSTIDDLELDRDIKRLEFWSSTAIGPLVRSCGIIAASRRSTRRRIGFSTTLLSAVFERLPCFIGLQRLYAVGIDFNRAAVDVLCRLPALDQLGIRWCNLAPGVHSSLHISRFSYSGLALPNSEWLRLLHPDHLCELDGIGYPEPLAEGLDTLPSFPRVHKVSMPGWVISGDMRLTLAFLSKFPAVEVLTLQPCGPPGPGPGVQASQLFPRLRKYSGPCHTLTVFLALPTLTCLTVYDCSPRDFIVQLEGIRTPSELTSLTLSFTTYYPSLDTFNIATFNMICGFFPRLAELRIDIVQETIEAAVNSVVTNFLATLAKVPVLPPTLKYFYLSWTFDGSDEFEDPPPIDKLPDFAELRDALLARCPSLASLWLDGGDFLFRWRKSLDGAIVEAAADNPFDARGERHQEVLTSSFWNTR
ncbi:hypothetical protein FB451DRAFT_1171276 [Mycena latifolia]|nr:hypothetical protein FB451DRAFT_1171276 [Mycena latifolia]